MTKAVDTYFSIINDYFGEAFEIAKEEKFDKRHYIEKVSRIYDYNLAQSLLQSFNQEAKKINWVEHENEIRKLGGFKATYFGSGYNHLNSSRNLQDFLKKTALYADTIIVPDATLHEGYLWEKYNTDPRISCINIAIQAINFLAIEDLFKSETDYPICTLALSPYQQLLNQQHLGDIVEWRNKILMDYYNQVFEANFASLSEITLELSKITNYSDFLRLIKKPELVVNPSGNPITKQEYEWMIKRDSIKYSTSRKNLHPIVSIPEFIVTNQITNALIELVISGNTKSHIVTNFKGFWKNIMWIMRHDNEVINQNLKRNVIEKEDLIINALQNREFKWLGNVPLDKIKALRENGELADLREVLSKNIKEIENVSDEDFFAVGQQVKYNIETAIMKHEKQVNNLNREYQNKYKIGTASIIVSGALAFTSMIYPPLAVISAAVGGGTVVELVRNYVEHQSRKDELIRKPVALLFDAKNETKVTSAIKPDN